MKIKINKFLLLESFLSDLFRKAKINKLNNEADKLNNEADNFLTRAQILKDPEYKGFNPQSNKTFIDTVREQRLAEEEMAKIQISQNDKNNIAQEVNNKINKTDTYLNQEPYYSDYYKKYYDPGVKLDLKV